MEKKILIAAQNVQICESISELLASQASKIHTATSASEVRELNMQELDLFIISTPLSDEFGHELVADIRNRCSHGIIVLSKAELADEIEKKLAFTSAYVLPRPISRTVLLQAVKFVTNADRQLEKLRAENERLSEKLQDIQLINRAKMCLIEYLKMSEEQAHRHIQKQAMDTRTSQSEVAQKILTIYSNKV